MDVSKIKDEDSLRAWLEGRSREDAIAIAYRSVARASFSSVREMQRGWPSKPDPSALHVSRALIIAGVAREYPISEFQAAAVIRGKPNLWNTLKFKGEPPSGTEAFDHAARRARATSAMRFSAAADVVRTASVPAVRAAAIAAATAVNFAASAAATSTVSSSRPAVTSAVWVHIRNDAAILECGQNPFVNPLWHGMKSPIWFSQPNETASAEWGAAREEWDFWVRWWDGVIAGKPLDWELQKQVALIPDDDWQKGPEHIASLIRQIEAGFTKVQDTAPKAPKPESAHYLTQNRLVARMQAQGLAGQIVDVIERYARDTGCNDLPHEFQALRSMPTVLLQLGRKLADASTTEDALRAEVQRLNARVLRLESDLREAKARTLNGTFSRSFVEQAGKSLGDWKMWGALIGGVSYLGGVPAMVDAAQSIADSVQGIFGDRLPEPPHVDLLASPELPRLTDL
jgi:hypothetical protein